MREPHDRPPSDLLTPTLQGDGGATPRRGAPPFRLESQIWIGVLGGVLPMLLIGMINAGRLGLPAALRRRMLWIGIAAVALTVAIYAWGIPRYFLDGGPGSPEGGAGMKRGLRVANQILGGLLYLAYRRIQTPADRVFQFSEGEYASLWGPGLLAILASTVVHLVVIGAVVWLLRP